MLRAFALILCVATPVAAQTAFLHLPIACTLGSDCFIEDYVDTDPAEKNARDFTCGLNTRDGHKGTDIALVDFAAIDSGVNVRAAAAGRVYRTRDEMPDDRFQRGVTSRNACGNAVVLQHANGYASTYCHLKLGSIQVNPGETVLAGDVLGQVGLSGRTSHPHLHFQISKNNARIDPFRPTQSDSCTPGTPVETLWIDPPEYYAALLRFAGFSNAVPEFKDMISGKARIASSSPDQPMVIYVEAGFSQQGDVLEFSVDGPAGEAFSHSILMKSPRKSERRAFGKRAPQGGWPLGDYTGRITLTRHGKLIANRFSHVTVSD